MHYIQNTYTLVLVCFVKDTERGAVETEWRTDCVQESTRRFWTTESQHQTRTYTVSLSAYCCFSLSCKVLSCIPLHH